MAYSHNCLLRGLNAIVLQAPHVPSSQQPGYKAQDVKDLLFFIESWVKTVDHHHHTEETVMFPEIEKMAGQPGLLSGPQHQHEEFHDGLMQLRDSSAALQKTPQDWTWESTKATIDSFAPALLNHLNEEIDVFLAMDKLDSAGLRQCWDKAETAAKAAGKISFLVSILSIFCYPRYQLTRLAVRHLPLRSRNLRQDIRGRQRVPSVAGLHALCHQVLVRRLQPGRLAVCTM